ncbi:hypothetical protein [Biformimicrobium ophioploci]|uniref:SnoaL-like domain-containing protein n=1 Tax=Biformimicrobium ophioploci TaxID=3036711 RepID=A0ABQ6LVC1_9GAMM|nr:hypothetical protein [Microbulbifer sp. NKW57]GMG86024.1 hypothetical protein MNKW57_03450 [Microbulbifer sp. NKW57]
MSDLKQKIHQFFQHYRRCFETQDAEEASQFFHFPASMYSAKGEREQFSKEEFLPIAEKLFQNYRALHVSQILGNLTNVTELNPATCIASLNWVVITGHGDDAFQLYSATTHYLICEEEDGYRIESVFVVDEPDRIREALEKL